MEDFGFPPVFPDDTEAIEAADAGNDATTEVDLTKKPKKVCICFAWLTGWWMDGQVKSKVAAKGGNITYQWNILKMLGISDEEVKRSSLIS